MKAPAKLWLTADRERLVQDGSRDAAFLYCMPGQDIPDADARKYGLLPTEEPAEVPAPVQKGKKAQRRPPEDKAMRGPEESKSETPFPAPSTYNQSGSGLTINTLP